MPIHSMILYKLMRLRLNPLKEMWSIYSCVIEAQKLTRRNLSLKILNRKKPIQHIKVRLKMNRITIKSKIRKIYILFKVDKHIFVVIFS